MSMRSVLGAFRAGSNGAVEVAAQRIASQQQRTFTATASRPITRITHFTPTDSPELDAVLSEIRNKIILPSYLPQHQRKKIYAPSMARRLQSDPITVEIDGELLKFRHLDPLRGGIPGTRAAAVAALARMQTPRDWANLRPLLEGLHHTRQRLDPDFHAKVVRVCGTRGQVRLALECAASPEATGLRLDTPEKANELLHWIQLKALDALDDAAAAAANPPPPAPEGEFPPPTVHARVAQALRWAERVVEMLAEDQHQPARAAARKVPLERDPQVLLARLHLAAATARAPLTEEERADAGREGGKPPPTAAVAAAAAKTQAYAAELLQLWPRVCGLLALQPPEALARTDDMGWLLDPSKFVTIAAPLLRGLDAADAVVADKEVRDKLRARRGMVQAEIAEARRKALEKNHARGEAVYQRLYGAKK